MLIPHFVLPPFFLKMISPAPLIPISFGKVKPPFPLHFIKGQEGGGVVRNMSAVSALSPGILRFCPGNVLEMPQYFIKKMLWTGCRLQDFHYLRFN